MSDVAAADKLLNKKNKKGDDSEEDIFQGKDPVEEGLREAQESEYRVPDKLSIL